MKSSTHVFGRENLGEFTDDLLLRNMMFVVNYKSLMIFITKP